jgi:hypothetical protein
MQTNQIAEDLYVVERIIGKRVLNNKIFYKVKWQGYSTNESTWEKVSHLRYVPDLIDKYEKQLLKNSVTTCKESIDSVGDSCRSEELKDGDSLTVNE